jgi:hypothetical protein
MQSLIGVWKLVEAHAFDVSGQEIPSPLGPEPMGVAIFTAECALVTGCDGRSTLTPDTKREFVAYCGPYTFDGTEYVCRVDGASEPDLFPERVRHIRFESPTRMILIPKSRLFSGGSGLELTWERVD